MRLIRSLAALLLGLAGAIWFGPIAAQETVNELIDAAYAGTDPSLSLSRGTERPNLTWNQSPINLIMRDGEPLYAFAERRLGEAYAPSLGFACRPEDRVAVHVVLQKSTVSDAVEIIPDATHTMLMRPYGTNYRAEFPVQFLGWFDVNHRRYASFSGTISADHPLIRNLEDTSNLQFNLKENGVNTYYSSGGRIEGADVHLRPLLDACGGYEPAPPPTPEELPEVSVWAPSAAEIKWAVQTELDDAVRRIDHLREQCNTVGQTGNPIQALACIAGTASGISSSTVSFRVNTVELDRCVRATDGTAYCHYRTEADIRGASLAAQMVQNAQNFAESVGNYGWGSFVMRGGRWRLERVYIDCSIGESDINCQYEPR